MAADGLRLGSGSPLTPSFHLVLCQSTNYTTDRTETNIQYNICYLVDLKMSDFFNRNYVKD